MRSLFTESPSRREASSMRRSHSNHQSTSTGGGGGAATRRLRASNRRQQQQQTTAALLAQEAAAATASIHNNSRRRNMAFLKYGDASETPRSATSVHESRERARQLAMRMSHEEDSSPPQHKNNSFADFANFDASALPATDTSFFEQDPFAHAPANVPPQQQQQQQQRRATPDDSFVADWPTDFADSPNRPKDGNHHSHRSSSSSQPQHQQHHSAAATTTTTSSSSRAQSHRQHHHQQQQQDMRTPTKTSMRASGTHGRDHYPTTTTPELRPSTSQASSLSTGAAARRRVRQQMRTGGGDTTPPQSPYSTHSSRRGVTSNSSVGSSTSSNYLGDHQNSHHHHHTMQPYSHHSRGTTTNSNRSVVSGKSVASSTEDGSSSDIFDHRSNVGTGFTFDAFGLDATQMNAQLNEAMQDLAGSHPDFSFFPSNEDDDFANGRWNQQASPAVSRSSTPSIAGDHEDFVDGFRVTKQTSAHLPRPPPQQQQQYPPSPSERSSLTSESNYDDSRINLFKEKAAFGAPSRRQPPASGTEYTERGGGTTRRRMAAAPSLPDLAHAQPQIEFVGEDSEASFTQARALPPTSDAGAPSDVGVISDAGMYSGTESDVAVYASEHGSARDRRTALPLDVLSKKKSSTDTATTAETSATYQTMGYEEKKEEEVRKSSREPSRSVRTTQWQNDYGPSSNGNSRIPSPTKSPASQSSLTRQSLERHEARIERPQASAGREWPRTSPTASQSPASPRRSPRSEGGAMVRSSHVSSVMDRIKARETSPQSTDAKSDVGSTPSPYQVKLRKTGLLQRPSEDNAESPVQRASLQGQSPRQATTSPAATSSSSSPRKMTYRERRELELQKEWEEQQKNESASKPPEKDVASLIRQRVAANKKALSPTSAAAVEANEAQDQLGMLKPTKVPLVRGGAAGQEASHSATPGRVTAAAAVQAKFRRQASAETDSSKDLSIESGDPSVENGNVKPSAAVSHLLMLQQIQSKNQSTNDDDDISPEKRHQMLVSVGSGDADEHRKSLTPKATKMMLNAFLAGRSSIGEGGEASASNAGDRSEGGASSTFPALKDDPKYQKYFKMLKLGMPKEQVQHAMTRDGEDPSILDEDPNKPVGVPLKDDPEYQKYFKMLRVGMPMEAVKHAMIRDGLDCSVMDQDHNLPVRKVSKKEEEEPKERDSHRRARLHWKTLRKVTSNSLWARLDQEINMEQIEIDELEFQELFQAEHNEVKPAKTSTTSSAKGSTVRVIDSKRANNGGIILARLKMSHDDMADAVDRINEHALTAEQIEHIIEYLPTKDERKALEAYMLEGGQDAAEKFEGLCECEKFMVSMMTVKHAKRKVRALLFKLQFEKCLDDILKDTLSIESACDNLIHSVRLRQLLGIILTFGNRLNTAGNKKRRAGAFTLDSLLKLNQAKAFDRKTTFLNYIVLIVQRNNEILLNFKDDLPAVFKADKVFWDQCLSDLEEVENQLENVRKIALYQARQTHYRFRRRKKQDDDGDESLGEEDMNLSLEEEVEALRSTPVGMFTLSAIKYVSSLRDKVEETKGKFAHLLEYFGEEDKNMQPHDLFSTMVTFCRDFDKAKEEVFALEKKKQREERKRQAGRPPTHSPAPPSDKKRPPMLRASSHQPNFSDAMRTSDRPPRRAIDNGVPEQAGTGGPHHVAPQRQSPRQASRHSYERSHSAPVESQGYHPNHAYSRSSSMQDQQHPHIQQQREVRHHSSHTVGTSHHSRPSHPSTPTQSAAARLKAKARMHQRSSAQSLSPDQVEYKSQVRDSPQAAVRQDYPNSNHYSPARIVSSPSNQSTDSGRSAARSSFRERRRQEVRERIRQANSRE